MNLTKFIKFKTDKQTEEIRKIKEEEKTKRYEKFHRK